MHPDYSPSHQEAVNPTYLLAWIPESLLNERGTDEWDKFVKIEDRSNLEDEDEGFQSGSFLFIVITDPRLRCSSDRPPYVESGIIRILGSVDIHIFIVSAPPNPLVMV